MKTAFFQPLVDAFAVAYWFPSAKKRKRFSALEGGSSPLGLTRVGERGLGGKARVSICPRAVGSRHRHFIPPKS